MLYFGLSPAELLMDRKLVTTLPDLTRSSMLTQRDQDMFIEDVRRNKIKEKEYSDNKYTLKKRVLEENEEVFIRDLQRTGVIRCRENGINQEDEDISRSYIVDTNKQTVRRNRKDLISISNNNNVITRTGRIIIPPDRLIEQ